ncbi:MAG: nuclear transport factor 2 family protein [Pyrinomonadaceae bacterium]|nr:nuclear transport factor 2 family protein [Pyrinomonadaceae bacterium]MCX7638976.1 nuclear transport factor 2 family protein [Pyrinomonadaceae bacterium]MDW8303805.1 nuclear transport factor 2 family protein [Acidobacteriota bacterium]
MRLLICLLLGLFIVVLSSCKKSGEERQEIKNLRQKIEEAVKARDERVLEELFDDRFTHTHASGKVDSKRERIRTLLSGEKTLETAKPEEMQINVFDGDVAVVTGRSYLESDDARRTAYRWINVYAKVEGKWRFVASQATKIQE